MDTPNTSISIPQTLPFLYPKLFYFYTLDSFVGSGRRESNSVLSLKGRRSFTPGRLKADVPHISGAICAPTSVGGV
jgi:hypothetical protein